MYNFASMTDTRQAILEKNFEVMRLNGFQGTRSDKIIEDLGITKGAFYYYFPTKRDLGYAVIDEMLTPGYLKLWGQVRQQTGTAPDRLVSVIRLVASRADSQNIRLGCPLNNLVQEMAPIDEGFKQRLDSLSQQIIAMIRETIESGIREGSIRPEVNPTGVAHLVWASVEGSFSIGKASQSTGTFLTAIEALVSYINSLRT